MDGEKKMTQQWRLLVLAAQHEKRRRVHVDGAAHHVDPVVRSTAGKIEFHLSAISGRAHVINVPIAGRGARKIGLEVGHLKGGEISRPRFDMPAARNLKMDRRCGRRPRHSYKVHHLDRKSTRLNSS